MRKGFTSGMHYEREAVRNTLPKLLEEIHQPLAERLDAIAQHARRCIPTIGHVKWSNGVNGSLLIKSTEK